MADRDLDLVLLGATGFTGGLTADYLAAHAPDGLRWALAGRSADKLAAVRDRLGLPDLELVVVDSSDPAGLAAMAARTRLVVTTVGPYQAYGEPLVAACAAAGTDYCDLTGEPEFVDRMYVAHHETAVASGARLVHCCGFDSIPHDLGVLHAVDRLPDDQPITAYGVVRASGTFSGGTFHSAVGAFSRAGEMRKAHAARRQAEPRPEGGRRSRAVGTRPRRDSRLGFWLLPLPTIDPMVVARSGAALASYGPDFRYSHYAGTKTLPYAVGGLVGAGAVGLAAQVPLTRRAMLSLVKQGDGPDEERRARSRFSVDVVASAGDTTVHTRVSGGDPGYTETAKMLAESALCLLADDVPTTAGQVTTAQAMGQPLIARLEAAGMRFETVA
ncbi:saccharopine dehydrogenase NADP-binding domain-containing protein [uncultured Nocardioides sp.]|uniref:saccharopine dehydrogenase family protein n=1 Tax=uncultured Nocardioides sp. TaxID=198441 RepID=UPI00260224A1|nr:saccharopine dehydrogenase NADP-binding domain-containing protein [uncultured Nocardioides sp.]